MGIKPLAALSFWGFMELPTVLESVMDSLFLRMCIFRRLVNG